MGRAEITIFLNSFRRTIQRYQQWRARLKGNLTKDQNVLPTLPDFDNYRSAMEAAEKKNFRIR